MKKILLLSAFIPFFFSSCVVSTADRITNMSEPSKDFPIAAQIKDKINQDLMKEGFFLTNSHGDYHPTINLICDDYSTILYQYDDFDDVRQLICGVVKKYLIAFNNDAQVRPLLHDYPITPENLQIAIYFFDNNHDTLPAPYISLVECKNGTIEYFVLNEDEVSTCVLSEPFDDACSDE